MKAVFASSRRHVNASGLEHMTGFVVGGTQARKDILSLHRRYGGEAKRFNYLGEWHSHPNAPAVPSLCDEMTMTDLLAEQAGAVNFLVLVVVRVSHMGVLEIGAVAYLASGHILLCED